jgi:acylphosphatase
MRIRAHVFVSGRVQGVFFRSKARQEARQRAVTGWARNLPDGRVEAVFEGDEKDVEKLIEFCRKGPIGAMVTKAEVSLEPYTGDFEDFQVKW